MIKVTQEEGRHKIELFLEEERASWLTVVDYEIYLAGIPVRMGGIGGVGTKQEYRNRGYSRQCLAKAVDVMTEQGYHLSMLFGIGDYYHRWGYASCLPLYETKISTRSAEKARSFHDVRQYEDSDLPAILRIYQECNSSRTGAPVRRAGSWEKFRMGSTFFKKPDVIVLEGAGEIEGYAVFDQEDTSVMIAEVSGTNPTVYSSVLAEAAKRAIAIREGAILTRAPLDHPIVMLAHQNGCFATAQYLFNRDGMGRIINLQGLMELIGAKLLTSSGLDPERDAIMLDTDLGQVILGTRRNGVLPTVRVDQMALTQLIFGYASVEQMIVDDRITGNDESLDKLKSVFPMQYAHFWGPDKF